MKRTVIVLAAAGLWAAGCHSTPNMNATLQRGWIGGEYSVVKRGLMPPGRRSAAFVKQVFPDTPAAEAGLAAADLILAFDGQAVPDLRTFRRLVDAAQPGSRARIEVLRGVQSLELELTVGRETYQQWHALSLGLHAAARFDLWPDPDFSLLPLAQYQRPQSRAELRSPETVLATQSAKARSEGEAGTRSEEGWDAWFLLFGFNAHKRILTQEMVLPTTAIR